MELIQEQLLMESKYGKSGRDELLHKEVDIDSKFMDVVKCLNGLKIGKGAEAAIALYLEILSDNQERHIQSIGTCIGSRMGKSGLEAITVGLNILEATVNCGLFDLLLFNNSVIVRPLIRVSDVTQEALDSQGVMPPMLIRPLHWSNNKNGGYITQRSHVILKKRNKHDKEVCLDVLNKLQDIELEMDSYILFKYIETEEIEFNIEIYMNYIDKSFWYRWNWDFRGRGYTAGYDINFQSTEFKKALHNLKKRELITK